MERTQLVDIQRWRDAIEEQVALEQRIAFLHHELACAQVARPPRDGSAGVGSFVIVRDLVSGDVEEYQLVAQIEANASRRRVSVQEPLGAALMRRRIGDVATFVMPLGPRTVEVVNVAAREGSPA